jgi:hypothetical protein
LTCKGGDIYLFSAEYQRIFKNPNPKKKKDEPNSFYDIMVDQLFNYKKDVKNITQFEKFQEFLKKNEIYMYKVGGIQIQKSPRLMNKLLEYYKGRNVELQSGGIYKKNKKSRKTKKRILRKKSNKRKTAKYTRRRIK